ncbi:dinitrogenase iron-molybdenum cofactor [bacterium BMS3Abin03]|nr:dinitrogenase iron-molybdenum cofactor [bacterium BMS3Abin03]
MEMERRLIAIGTKQNGKLWGGHFGMAPFYDIYSTEGKFIERRENPFGAGSGKHEHHDNPKLIVDLLRECKVFIARNIGPDSKKKLLKKFGITVILTDVDETEKALKEFLKSNGKSNTTK